MSQSQKHISTLTLLNQATYLILLFLVKSLQGMIVVFNEGIYIILIMCIYPHTTKNNRANLEYNHLNFSHKLLTVWLPDTIYLSSGGCL